MHYLIGDIHGEFSKLLSLLRIIENQIDSNSDEIIFLGDYIDRGLDSYKVVEKLLELSKQYKTTFIMGNHEQMLYEYMNNDCSDENYLLNGGQHTVNSYRKNLKEFYIPEEHEKILFSNIYFYETDDFIAVHAGINPQFDQPSDCDEFDLLWIREEFFKTEKKWKKTIIFGHTPTFFITKERNKPFFDENKNIIGIDTGAVYFGSLTCIRMPDRKIYQVN